MNRRSFFNLLVSAPVAVPVITRQQRSQLSGPPLPRSKTNDGEPRLITPEDWDAIRGQD
jgi:hypothetical protein